MTLIIGKMLKTVIISDPGIMLTSGSCFCCSQTPVSFIGSAGLFRMRNNTIDRWCNARIANFTRLKPHFQCFVYRKAGRNIFHHSAWWIMKLWAWRCPVNCLPFQIDRKTKQYGDQIFHSLTPKNVFKASIFFLSFPTKISLSVIKTGLFKKV